jgi:hypothetical protein
MTLSDIFVYLLKNIKTESTALQVINRFSIQVANFAVDELRQSPVSALAIPQTKARVDAKIVSIRAFLTGNAEIDTGTFEDFHFTINGRDIAAEDIEEEDEQILTFEVGCERHIGPGRNMVSTAMWGYALAQGEQSTDEVFMTTSLWMKVKRASDKFNDMLLHGHDFSDADTFINFMNYFTHSPKEMFRHGFMVQEDLDHPDFTGVQMRPVPGKSYLTIKFNHIPGRNPELLLPYIHTVDEATGKKVYCLTAAIEPEEA